MRALPVACIILLLTMSQPASALEAQPIDVTMTEFAFRPAVIRVSARSLVRLRFTNRGQITHQFESAHLRDVPVVVWNASMRVEAPGLDVVRTEAGTTVTLEFLARRRGRFPFACTIEGHREAGMVGVIEVR